MLVPYHSYLDGAFHALLFVKRLYLSSPLSKPQQICSAHTMSAVQAAKVLESQQPLCAVCATSTTTPSAGPLEVCESHLGSAEGLYWAASSTCSY